MSHTVHCDQGGDSFVIELPWDRPPLTLNGREHRMEVARTTREVRGTAKTLAQRVGIDRMIRPSLNLVWLVTSRHKRDADNVVPTLKALADGIVDAGVAEDDTPELMHKSMPVIQYAKGHPKAPGLFLVIWEAGGSTADELRALKEIQA